MEIDLSDEKLVSVTPGYNVVLEFGGDHVLNIENAMSLHQTDGEVVLDPQVGEDAQFQLLQRLIGTNGGALRLDEGTGSLDLTFSDGTRITVPKNGDYEAWEYDGPDGLTIVCLPSGELAVFGPSSD